MGGRKDLSKEKISSSLKGNNCMNNDNALMLEALAKSRSPKQVLREGDEFEDDDDYYGYNSPGIRKFYNTSPYKVKFFPKPGNPEGIIIYAEWPHARVEYSDDKAEYWANAEGNFSSVPRYGELDTNDGTWEFRWNVEYAKGFIEGEDFIFVKK